MKPRYWIAGVLISTATLMAAEEAPPAELLKNIDFYQNMDMVQDPQFLNINNQKPAATAASNAAAKPVTVTTASVVPPVKGDSNVSKQ
jgi:hypothetical protein